MPGVDFFLQELRTGLETCSTGKKQVWRPVLPETYHGGAREMTARYRKMLEIREIQAENSFEWVFKGRAKMAVTEK